MNARRALVVVFLFAFAALLLFRLRSGSEAGLTTVGASSPYSDAVLAVSRLDTDKGIAQFETRVTEDPRDFISLTILGQLYGRRGRDKGNLADFVRAEQSFHRALQLNADHAPATAALAAAYTSQHKFADALAVARDLYEKSPASLEALATMTDAYLETGQYAQAEESLRVLSKKIGEDPAVLARRAQFAELKGQTGPAVTLLQRAIDTMRRNAEPAPEIAWFEARLGDVYYHTGCLAESERHFDASLRLFDTYPVGLAGLADVRAAQGRLEDARDLYARAVAESAQPRRLFDLGLIEERLGNGSAAQRRYQQAEDVVRAAGENQAAYYRELAMFNAERLGKAAEALEWAQKDLAVRKDVRTYDVLAWALYRNKRFDEAKTAIAEAMKLGTRDPDFFYHAGMIYDALGDRAKAASYLEEAARISPRGRPDLMKIAGPANGRTCDLRN
jgi:tetratricopeptide (TPR) repeat protein